ncbi:unnamed protein product [Prunus armeniaca]|uniref:Uncharacterized protein n=1 Tax=Prunus armeniaca TaxID=36596 RepID=A0A6J5W6F7_PRUAR|nr:unnamed protein product [Prunus armeniaca]
MEDPFKSFYINITFEPQGDKALQQNHNFVFACLGSMDFNVVMNHDVPPKFRDANDQWVPNINRCPSHAAKEHVTSSYTSTQLHRNSTASFLYHPNKKLGRNASQ